MSKLLVLALFALIAGCGQPEEIPEDYPVPMCDDLRNTNCVTIIREEERAIDGEQKP